jgi:hypothetical protein
MKKILAAVASLTLLAAPLAASAQSFGHDGDHGGGYGHGNGGQRYGGGDHRGGYGGYGGYGRGYGRGYDNGGAALAAGAFGLVVGSALASHSYGYDEPYGYSQPYGYEGDYGARCFWQNRAYRDGDGDIEYRQVQICR